MKIGYSYWGFLADVKMNKKLEEISTPDGNAFYSWSIIRELQDTGNEVIAIMPDRDKYAVSELGLKAFTAWVTEDRYLAYTTMTTIEYPDNWETVTLGDIFRIWDHAKVNELDYIIHEWRMPIENRNTLHISRNENWQPDLFLQQCLLKYCDMYNIKLFIFDLDYKLQLTDIKSNVSILELGTKWHRSNAKKVYIPFGFDHINDFPINSKNRKTDLVYVGNRYERDWCIDKYIPNDIDNCVIYGNWKEGGRDSENRWPKLKFGKRLQTNEMHKVYSDSICTILLAKEEYCKYNFMTARLIEAVFYGTVPLFIEEYGNLTIREYAGIFSTLLTVKDKEDVKAHIEYFKNNPDKIVEVISYLRGYLIKMDASNFIKVIKEML